MMNKVKSTTPSGERSASKTMMNGAAGTKLGVPANSGKVAPARLSTATTQKGGLKTEKEKEKEKPDKKIREDAKEILEKQASTKIVCIPLHSMCRLAAEGGGGL